MKNFSELLDTERWLDIEIKTSKGSVKLRWPLLVPLDLAGHDVESVSVDGMSVLEFGYYQDSAWIIRHDRPFYQWRHDITGQGWLLEPVKGGHRVSSGNV